MERRDYRLVSGLGYLALPLALYIIFLFGGFFTILQESLGYIPGFNMTDISFENYISILGTKEFWKSALFSLYIGFFSAILSTWIGVYIAQYIVFSDGRITKFLIEKLSLVLMILPYMYMVLLVFSIFSGRGIVARLLDVIGLKFDLLYDPLGISIIVAYVLKGAPFVALYVLSVMTKIKKDYMIAGILLGASKKQVCTSVYIPLCKNGILWSSTILFAYNLGSYEIPMLLTNIKQQTLSQLIYRLYTSSTLEDIPRAMAANILLLIVTLIFGVLYANIVTKSIERGVK